MHEKQCGYSLMLIGLQKTKSFSDSADLDKFNGNRKENIHQSEKKVF